MVWFELLPGDRLGVKFPYRKDWVSRIKRLSDRSWNEDLKRWEVPLSALPEVVEMFTLDWKTVPRSVRNAYENLSKVRTCLEVGNTFTRLHGFDLPLESLDEVTSFWMQGAEYSKLYQDGKWDGYRHLLVKRGGLRFPTGLIHLVQQKLTEAGHEYVVDDRRKVPEPGDVITPKGPPLRDYQKKVIRTVARQERGVLQMATGAGKTLVAAHIIASKGLPTLFFVHTKDLLYQAIRVFSDVLQVPVGQIGDGKVEPQKITVATIQTTAKSLNVKVTKTETDEVPLWKDEASEKLTITDLEAVSQTLKQCRMAIFDECHHLPAETFYDIAMKLDNAFYRYGLSATPWRSDRSDLMIEAALGKKLCVVSSSDLIRKGYLVPPKITMYEVLPTRKQTPRRYPTVYKSEVVEHIQRNQLIAEVAEHMKNKGKTVLILVSQIQHGKNLEEMIEDAVFIHGKDTSEVRNQALERLREKTHPILIATTLADEGLDLPSLDALILAGGGKSETRALQRIGRVLRPHPGKKNAIVVDFYDQTRYLEEHSRQRYEIYRTEEAFEVEIRPPKKPGAQSRRQKTLSEI